MTGSLSGKTALVTGSGKGLGSAIAIDLARHGANVVVHYNSSIESAARVFEEVQKNGGGCILVKADISKMEGVNYLLEETQKAFNGADILVNNAAIQFQTEFDDYEDENVRKLFNTNLRCYILAMRGVLPYMKAQKWGRIINISSVHAKRPTMFDPCYCMAKGAIKMLTREAALELFDNHITVNSIEVGAIEIGVKTGNPPSIITDEDRCLTPLFKFKEVLRIGMPADVAHFVSFLAGEDTGMISGTALRIDGTALLS